MNSFDRDYRDNQVNRLQDELEACQRGRREVESLAWLLAYALFIGVVVLAIVGFLR